MTERRGLWAPRIKRRTPEEITAENLKRYLSGDPAYSNVGLHAIARTREFLSIARLKMAREYHSSISTHVARSAH